MLALNTMLRWRTKSKHSTTALRKKNTQEKSYKLFFQATKECPKISCSSTPTFTLISIALVVCKAVLYSSLLEILRTLAKSSSVLVISATHSWSILPPLISFPYKPLLRLTQALYILYVLEQP